jgi:thiamine-phosphate pyrophosphorylase
VKPGDRRERLGRSRLYVVTGARDDLPDFLEAILGAGVDIVQLREKDAEAGDLLQLGQVFRDAARRHDALFIVNDRPDVALALEADGVHLGQNDLPPAVARDILGPEHIVGLSTHSAAQWDAAAPEADYLCAGPIWETPTKPGRPAVGLDYVRYAAKSGERRPWFAIGGVNEANLDEVLEAGAGRIVVARAVTDADDPAASTRALTGRMHVRDPVDLDIDRGRA